MIFLHVLKQFLDEAAGFIIFKQNSPNWEDVGK